MLLGVAVMIQHTESKYFELENLQLAGEQSTQLREVIVSDLELHDICCKVIKPSLLLYGYTIY